MDRSPSENHGDNRGDIVRSAVRERMQVNPDPAFATIATMCSFYALMMRNREGSTAISKAALRKLLEDYFGRAPVVSFEVVSASSAK